MNLLYVLCSYVQRGSARGLSVVWESDAIARAHAFGANADHFNSRPKLIQLWKSLRLPTFICVVTLDLRRGWGGRGAAHLRRQHTSRALGYRENVFHTKSQLTSIPRVLTPLMTYV